MKPTTTRTPIRHDIVLIGGGHSHVQVITAFGMRPEPGVRLTLVTDQLETPYSAMLPGHVAGRYRRDEMHIDLARLTRAAGVRLIHAAATGIDRAAKCVVFDGRPPLRFDTLSINIGIAPDFTGIDGAEEFALPVKPISRFTDRLEVLLQSIRQPQGPRHFAVVGGGAAGIELSFAFRARLNSEAERLGLLPDVFTVTLVSGDIIIPTLNDGVRRRVLEKLNAAGIRLITGRIARIAKDALFTTDGQRIAADAAILSTAARAPSWLAGAGMPLAQDGSLRTYNTLQVMGETTIFATGDCAVIDGDVRPKAGVFAVRQGPVLAANLRAAARGKSLRPYRAQRAFLTILETADGAAIAGRGRFFSAGGRLVLGWKEWIDHRFMRMFADFGSASARPSTAEEIASGVAMRCGGCA
ncbi:MAG: FAD-dependent oxidoreductase, partial [Beijerinckiaceae bacterium]